MTTKTISVIGAGAWGTALAQAISIKGQPVTLWARETEVVESINASNENTLYLPDIALHENIKATNDLSSAVQSDVLLLVTPAQHLRSTLESIKNDIKDDTVLIICSKGIELDTGTLLSEIAAEITPNNPIAILSGPTFASELAKGLPTGLTLAMKDQAAAKELQDLIGSPTFRPYVSDDIIGAQIAGAVKNVMAIACGIIHGRGMGDNTRAALVTRGLAEIVRLGEALGAQKETFLGLSGIGDLMLTCSSMQSRNFSFGAALGEGQSIDDILKSRNAVTEGIHTCKAALSLAQKHGVDMPITESLNKFLSQNISLDVIIGELLNRPPGTEN